MINIRHCITIRWETEGSVMLFHLSVWFLMSRLARKGAFTYDVGSRGGGGFKMLTVADKGGRGYKPCWRQQKYLNFGKNCLKSSVPITMRETTALIYSPKLMTTFSFKGGGGGDNGYFFVKLDFEIAVDQQTRTSDRTFEGVPDPNRQTVPAGQPRPYLVQIRPNLAKYPEHAQNPYFMCSTCS